MDQTIEGRLWCQRIFLRLIEKRLEDYFTSEMKDETAKMKEQIHRLDEGEWVERGLMDHMIVDFCSGKNDPDLKEKCISNSFLVC